MPQIVMSFGFSQPEIKLTESDFDSYDQLNVDLTFDQDNHIHIVYDDGRSDVTTHLYGITYMADNVLTSSYRTYQGIEGETHIRPFVSPSTYWSDRAYVGGINVSTSTDQILMGYLDLSALPVIPSISAVDSYITLTNTGQGVASVSGNFFVFTAYAESGTIYLNYMDEQLGNWGIETFVAPAQPGIEEYSEPALAMDDQGYIYLAYNFWESGNSYTYCRIRRSIGPYDISYFNGEREVAFDYDGNIFRPAIAARGSINSLDLQVAVAYRGPSTTSTEVIGNMEPNGDWTSPIPTPFAGIGPYVVSSTLGSTVQLEGPDIAYDEGGSLYVVWSDDRDAIFKLYGNMSFDGGFSMLNSNEINLSPGIQGISGPPRIATGKFPGDIAVAYSRNTGVYTNPYLLVNRATFFDSCDMDPGTTGYWTNYTGVTAQTTQYYSPPGAYEMITGRGTLIRDFGAEEKQGSVTLQFYDTESHGENFYIALENNNSRGIIRMLGVKNETTTQNYAYSFDNVTWHDTNGVRSTGWHEITFLVTDTGLDMQIDLNNGSYATASDPTFTSFTSVKMEGGSGSSPYYVDDIRVETYPLIATPPVLPATGPLSIGFSLIILGILVLRRR